MLTRPYGGADTHSKMIVTWKELQFALAWRDIPKPTIAAVQGYCIFNAWITMSMMDVVFAAEDAQFHGDAGLFRYFSSNAVTPSQPAGGGLRRNSETLSA